VRKLAIPGILCLAVLLLSGPDVLAFTYEVHPGIYASYEYSDNYRGTAQDEQGESTYYIGPSLNLRLLSASSTLDLTARYAKSFHQEFKEDDSPEINVIAEASVTLPRQTARFSYEFERTLTRDSLSDPYGEVYRHTGSIAYTAELSQDTNMNAGANISSEDWKDEDSSGENLVNTGGNFGITHRLNPADAITMTAGRDYHFYEISEDVTETRGGISISHVFSRTVNMSLNSSYNHAENGHDPNEDRYGVSLAANYEVVQSLMVGATGGYNWIVPEEGDTQGENIAGLTIDKTFQDGSFHLGIMKEYTSDFTANRYGTYDTRRADASWTKQWLQDWTSSLGGSISKRRPVSDTTGEFEIDSNANVTITWTPLEYFTGNVIYEHLQTNYESSDTVRENRYRLVMEARY